MKSEWKYVKAAKAKLAGKRYTKERIVGRGLGRKMVSELLPKREVDPVLIDDWRLAKQMRKDRLGRKPFSGLNTRIRRCFKEISAELGLEEEYDSFDEGEQGFLSTVYGPAEAFEPYSGLAWYALEIERVYDNARTHVWSENAEVGAYYAFNLGMLLAEFEAMRNAGSFLDQAQRIKQSQREAGRASTKVSKEARQSAYRRYRTAGDKRTEAAKNAATELGVSLSTIRNSFPDSRLPD